jgi:hypothetical protein
MRLLCVLRRVFPVQAFHVEPTGEANDGGAGGPGSPAAASAPTGTSTKVRLMAGALLLLPDAVARAAEVRLWAAHRSNLQVWSC